MRSGNVGTYDLAGRTIVLRPLVPGDYGPLYQMATVGRAAVSWRLRGRSISPDAFPTLLWSDCLAQFVIASKSAEWSIVGLISAFNHDAVAGTAYLSVLLSEASVGATTALGEATILFGRYLQAAFGIRKIYAESSEFSLTGLEKITDRFECIHVEGRLRDHLLIDGRYWDLTVMAIYTDQLLRESAQFEAYLAGHVGELKPGKPSFNEFCSFVSTEAGISEAVLDGGTLLTTDLQFDSLTLLECLTALEARYGLHLPEAQVPHVKSVQDLYELLS